MFEKEKNKNIIISLHAFLHELTEIIYECSDPEIARIKYKWWQEEIKCLSNKQPGHPVTREISKAINFNKQQQQRFNRLIKDFEKFLFVEQTDSLESCLSLYRNTSGMLWQQCALILGCTEQTSLSLIDETGALTYFLDCLQQPDTYINDTRCIIPSSYITQSKLLELRINHAGNKTLQTELFTSILLELKARLDETYSKFPKRDRSILKHALILNRLAAKTCEEILYDGCHLLEKRISLTPAKKIWIAWRTNFSINHF